MIKILSAFQNINPPQTEWAEQGEIESEIQTWFYVIKENEEKKIFHVAVSKW